MLQGLYQIHTATSVSIGKAVLQNNAIELSWLIYVLRDKKTTGLCSWIGCLISFLKLLVVVLSSDSLTGRVLGAVRRNRSISFQKRAI